MSKAIVFRIINCFLFFFALFAFTLSAAGQHRSRLPATKFPVACYFFEPVPQSHSDHAPKQGTAKSRAYDVSFSEVYRVWCTPNKSTHTVKEKAVDAMVRAWKASWDEDEPYNSDFHETGAYDLLALIGLTHELPLQIAGDSEFRKAWVEDCAEHCFTIWSVPENTVQEHGLAMQLWLRNDVLDHLKREPASEPVIKMLEEAQFRLVD